MSPPAAATVRVDLGPRSYDIAIGTGLLADAPRLIADWCQRRIHTSSASLRCLVVTDAHVESLHARSIVESLRRAGDCERVALAAGEESKRLDVIAGLYDQLVAMKADRRTVVVAVGGGVVGDAAGFAAATYARGIPFVQIPTTLLAQVDSSVGGKVGINHAAGKNLIGAFHQPLGVIIDPETLATLPDRDYRSGLAEVIKYGVILDADFFHDLETRLDGLNNRAPDVMQTVVARCCRLKADVVEQDEEERTGLRAVLNYGHTFAHAFEALAGYGQLLHGEAVAIGMIYAGALGQRLGRVDAEFCERQQSLIEAVGLPTALPPGCDWSTTEILDRMRLDKKAAAGRLRFVLPTRMGHVELVDDVPEDDVLAVLTSLG